ncbi:hypothetical protein ABPG72_022192 [Tetrahymena utriculariae]
MDIKPGTFLDIYSQSETVSDECFSFQQNIFQTTNRLFEEDKQEFVVIWGDPNDNEDNKKVKQGLIQYYPFLKDRIYKFENSKGFRDKATELASYNILFLMSGRFGYYMFNGVSNLQWVNDNIKEQKIHSKTIILFTSLETVKSNNWTIENLQKKFKYVTQLAVDYYPLFISFDKMIFNRIHRSFVQISHLDYYFRADTEIFLDIFQNPDSHSFKELMPSAKILKQKFEKLCEYVKNYEIQAPLTLYLSDIDLQSIIQNLELCFEKNGASNDNKKIVQNIINLYTQETPVYKILNLSINTMNSCIYSYLENIYRLLSKCLYLYNDEQTQSNVRLVRGAAIQKYQYDTLYEEFMQNHQKNIPTLISFPQFLSTSTDEKVAKSIIKTRMEEVKVETTQRMQNLSKFSKTNSEYLQSEEFRQAYKILIYINANFDFKNNFRPKCVSKIAEYDESEYLFQPFQPFMIENMQEGNTIEGSQLKMTLKYML